MEEKQVTVDGATYPLQAPFMVVATQNPIEQEGTYHLPEAQLDRFLFKINVSYPSTQEELKVLLHHHNTSLQNMVYEVQPVISAEDLKSLRDQVRNIHIEEKLLVFITTIVSGTRNNKNIYLGASPRASIGILNGAKAIAAMRGRDFVTPDDIIFVAPPVLRHRIVITPEKEMEGASADSIIDQLIHSVEIPR